MSLGIAIPLLNEADSLSAVVRDLLAATAPIPRVCLALVNNGSHDDTGPQIDALAQQHPQRILSVHLAQNAGYGGGILAGLRALPPDLDVVGWMWGDNQIDPLILRPLYELCQRGQADLAKARRVARQDGWQRRAVTTVYAATMRLGVGAQTPDVNGCPKLLRRPALERLALTSTDWFLDAEAILKAERLGLRVVDRPTTMRPRQHGKSKVRLATVQEFARHILAGDPR